MSARRHAPDETDDRRDDAPTPAEGLESDECARADESAAGDDGRDTAEDLDAARLEAQDLLERLQRTTADYQNFQKRTARRLEETRRFAVQELVLDLVPVIDNFERALAAAEAEPEVATFREGIQLVHDQLLAALAKHGVERIDAAGRPFDPEDHEAVAHVPSEDVPDGRVAEVFQTGYRLNGRTIRASRVGVSSGPAEEA
jgi:molecular chaperone GrpE